MPVWHPCCLPFAELLHTDARVRYPCCLLRTAFGTHPTCYLHSFYAVQHGVRYPRALVRYPCCLFRTPFGTHPACYLHRFCTHRNMPFGTQGPRSAPKGSKLRDPYRKSRFPLWPVNNLTAKVSGRGWAWMEAHPRPPNIALYGVPVCQPGPLTFHYCRVCKVRGHSGFQVHSVCLPSKALARKSGWIPS